MARGIETWARALAEGLWGGGVDVVLFHGGGEYECPHVRLDYARSEQALYATGVYGGDMLERFLTEFGFQVALAHKRDDIREPARDTTTVWPMREYSRSGAC